MACPELHDVAAVLVELHGLNPITAEREALRLLTRLGDVGLYVDRTPARIAADNAAEAEQQAAEAEAEGDHAEARAFRADAARALASIPALVSQPVQQGA